ncbi:MAG: HD domain-containing protein [Lachnospiraceae bacterium]|nr:HD domain-containing protein [Lachnospiraceae bacterium]MBR5992555.1 HD domain-containing protein [Lachnospiraceae bacterium]
MSKNRNHRQDIRKDIRKYGGDILRSDNFKSSAQNIQHSNVSVMKHSMKVAYASMWITKKLRLKCNKEDLVRGALLHDYFLYDWHDDEHRGLKNLHGFYHPGVALKNAMAEYTLTDRQKNIISSHMWPLTLRHIPKCKEAWVVTAADKYVSTMESLRLNKLAKTERIRSRIK